MLRKYYVKYILFVLLLLVVALIINKKSNKFILDVSVRQVETIEVLDPVTHHFVVYVANDDLLLVPMNIEVTREMGYQLKGYESRSLSEVDLAVYYTFSLLTNNSNYLPVGVKTLVPRTTMLLDYELNGKYLTLNVSNDFYFYNKSTEWEMLTSLIHTFHENLGVEYLKVQREGVNTHYEGYPNVWLNIDDFKINALFDQVTDNQHSYTIYYYVDIQDKLYLTPVTIFDDNVTNKKAVVESYLRQTIALPVMTFDDDSNYAKIQYAMTLKVNEITGSDGQSDLYEVNEYRVIFS